MAQTLMKTNSDQKQDKAVHKQRKSLRRLLQNIVYLNTGNDDTAAGLRLRTVCRKYLRGLV